MAIIVWKALRVLLLCLSCYGYLYLIVDKGKIKVEFSPAILFSAIGSAMFFAGILNILKETCFAIFIAGIAFAIYSFVKNIIHSGLSVRGQYSFSSVWFIWDISITVVNFGNMMILRTGDLLFVLCYKPTDFRILWIPLFINLILPEAPDLSILFVRFPAFHRNG